MKYYLLSCTLLMLTTLQAQHYQPDKISRQAQKQYSLAMEKIDGAQFEEAIFLLNNAISKEPGYIDARLTLAGVLGELRRHDEAVTEFENAFLLDPKYTEEFLLPYSIELAGIGAFDKALKAIDQFLQIKEWNEKTRKAALYRKGTYTFALEYEKKHPIKGYVFAPVNLGDSINSRFPEYFPSLTIDGKKLVFTRQVNFFNEDFFGAEKMQDSLWHYADLLSGNVNTERNEGAQQISQDGKLLVFTSCDAPEGFGSCDLYYSVLTRKGWSRPVNMGESINTENWESQPSIAPDNRALYFAARRPKGLGGSDIYVSYLMPDGSWGPPLNMGPTINTAGDETSPFIHADNQTLYFASNGLPGYGKMDLFLVRKDSAGRWQKPENLGYPINTIEEEATLFITSDGETAYYAANRTDSRGSLDLYKFKLRPDVQPIRTLWVTGKVYDVKTGQGLPSAVELKDLATGQRTSKVQTDEEGHYLITLPTGRDYAFLVNRRDYLSYSANFSLAGHAPDSTYTIDIPLQPIEVNASIVLRNIFFETGSFVLKKESAAELDNLFQLLNDNPTIVVQINGHTDNVGKASDNMTLSNHRARAVVDYLIAKGIDAARLRSMGYGETQPVAVNDTEEGRAKNRRTTMQVIRR